MELGRFLLLLLLCAPASADIKTDVEYLADDARRGRASGSQGIDDARDYITTALKAEGIPTYEQKVEDCANLIAHIRGSQPESYIVVGAHLDHMGVYRGFIQNGADDNASGSAVILELAKRVNQIRPIRTVVFVWFTREETGMNGSRKFVEQPFDCKLPVFMLNLDMVGHLKDNLPGAREKPGELAGLFKKYPFARRITHRGSDRGSDQRSFNGKCPTIFLHTGLHDIFHTSLDDADTLDYEGINKVCDYAYDLILQVAGRQTYRLWKTP